METFYPKVGKYNIILCNVIVIPFTLLVLIVNKAPLSDYLIVIPSLVCFICLFIILLFYTTRYWIKADHLHYRSLFFKGKIDIHRIRKIEVGKTLYTGIRPATSRFGIIIRYAKYEEIYCSPYSNKLMVGALLAVNPSIEVEHHQYDIGALH